MAKTGSSEKFVQKQLCRELIFATRFGMVGITATAVHIIVVSFLLSEIQFPTLLANTLAFLTAFSISFTGNYFWTFQTPGSLRKVMQRFLLISISAFIANTLLLATILSAKWFSPLFSAIVSATLIPVMTFLVSRLWVFRHS